MSVYIGMHDLFGKANPFHVYWPFMIGLLISVCLFVVSLKGWRRKGFAFFLYAATACASCMALLGMIAVCALYFLGRVTP